MTELLEALQRANGTRNTDDIVHAAAKHGHKIDRSAGSRHVNGEHGPKPRESTLAALVAGFGVDVRKLREPAGKPTGDLGPDVPVAEAASPHQRQRKAVDHRTLAIVGEGTVDDGLAPEDQKTPPAALSAAEELRLRLLDGGLPVDVAADTNERANKPKE